MQILRGFVAPFRGALFVARHGLWGYLAWPFVLNFTAALAAGWWGGGFVGSWLARGWLAGAPWLGDVAGGLLFLVVAILTFLVLQPVLSAPFIDLLCERAEKIILGADAPSLGLLRSAAQAVVHGVLKMLLYALALAVTLLAGSLTGVGGVVGAALYGLFLAFDGFDYPLARRDVSFSGKWRYLLSRPGQTVGYGCGAGLGFLVPFAALVVPAFAAVGATLTYLEAEMRLQSQRRPAAGMLTEKGETIR